MASAHLTHSPRSLREALDIIGNRAGVSIAHNTTLAIDGKGGAAVILHATAILTFRPSGLVQADTGGHRTRTTLARLRSLGVSIAVNGGRWILDGSCSHTGSAEPFTDGMCVVLRPVSAPCI